jgi:thiamine-phosphate pyrophosphorylase
MAEDDRIRCRLYLVTPPALEPASFKDTLAAALDAGDVASLQLRLKEVDDDAILRAGEALMPVAHAHDVAFIVNDRADLARDLGDDAIVGVTCHDSRHLAMEAAEKGADYVAFGAFFPTGTKEPKTKADPELLRWWQEFMVVPCVAIGGITVENARTLVEAGADFLAVVAGVWDHPQGPAAAVEAFNAIFDEVVGG